MFSKGLKTYGLYSEMALILSGLNSLTFCTNILKFEIPLVFDRHNKYVHK